MRTLESSKPSKKEKLFCLLRKEWLAASPEEQVRQAAISHLIDLGFPRYFLSIEKALTQAKKEQNSLKRRYDLLAYTKDEKGSLSPLLLIECKAERINERAKEQVIAYNSFIAAPFIALCSKNEEKMGYFSEGSYRFLDYIASYEELRRCIFS